MEAEAAPFSLLDLSDPKDRWGVASAMVQCIPDRRCVTYDTGGGQQVGTDLFQVESAKWEKIKLLHTIEEGVVAKRARV